MARYRPKWVLRWINVSLATQLMSCGGVGLGGNPYLTDPAPGGQLRFQGQFQNCSPGKSISGLAQVFQTASGEVLRLESLTVLVDGAQPNAGVLQVVSQYSSGGTTLSNIQTLRSSQGNQNYTLSALTTSTRTWSTVSIRTSTNPQAPAYCSAVLSIVGP